MFFNKWETGVGRWDWIKCLATRINITVPVHTIPKKNGYNMYQLNGTMNGKDGVFEIGLSKDGIIDHRFFRPTPTK